MAKAEGTSLLETPTYYVVLVLLAIVLFSSVFDKVRGGLSSCFKTFNGPHRCFPVRPMHSESRT